MWPLSRERVQEPELGWRQGHRKADDSQLMKSDAKMTSVNFEWIVKEREKSRILTGCLLA